MLVRASAGRHHVRARVTFKDATRAKTMTLRYRACAAARAAPAPRPVAVHRMSHALRRRRVTPRPCAGGFRRWRSRCSRRGRLLVLVAPARAAGPGCAASQPLVVLLHDHVARTAPSAHGPRIETVAARRPLTGVRTVLPVLGRAVGRAGQSWLHVRAPGRPNGHTGWISARQTRRAVHRRGASRIKLSARRVTVYRDGHVMRRFRRSSASPRRRRPAGRFFVEEALALSSQDAGGPFALATSARSNVLQEFDGGPGQIAPPRDRQPLGRARDRVLARLHPAQHPRHHVAGADASAPASRSPSRAEMSGRRSGGPPPVAWRSTPEDLS